MRHFETTGHIGPDGTLIVRAPSDFANSDVRVLLQETNGTVPIKTKEEWNRFIDSVAGTIDDPTFERPPQIELDDRKLFD